MRHVLVDLYDHKQNEKVYYFVTNYIDSSANGLSNFAPRDSLLRYNTI
jgi:hypothetical protein